MPEEQRRIVPTPSETLGIYKSAAYNSGTNISTKSTSTGHARSTKKEETRSTITPVNWQLPTIVPAPSKQPTSITADKNSSQRLPLSSHNSSSKLISEVGKTPAKDTNNTRSTQKDENKSTQREDARSTQKVDTNSNQREDARPAQREDARPIQRDDTRFLQTDGARFAQRDDARSSQKADSSSIHRDDARSAQKENARPIQRDDTRVTLKTDTRFPQKDDTRSAQRDDGRSAQKVDTNSNQREDARPAQRDDVRPIQRDDTRFLQTDGARFAQRDDARSSQKADSSSIHRDDAGYAQTEDARPIQRDDTRVTQRTDTRFPQKDDTCSAQRDNARSTQRDDTRIAQTSTSVKSSTNRPQPDIGRPSVELSVKHAPTNSQTSSPSLRPQAEIGRPVIELPEKNAQASAQFSSVSARPQAEIGRPIIKPPGKNAQASSQSSSVSVRPQAEIDRPVIELPGRSAQTNSQISDPSVYSQSSSPPETVTKSKDDASDLPPAVPRHPRGRSGTPTPAIFTSDDDNELASSLRSFASGYKLLHTSFIEATKGEITGKQLQDRIKEFREQLMRCLNSVNTLSQMDRSRSEVDYSQAAIHNILNIFEDLDMAEGDARMPLLYLDKLGPLVENTLKSAMCFVMRYKELPDFPVLDESIEEEATVLVVEGNPSASFCALDSLVGLTDRKSWLRKMASTFTFSVKLNKGRPRAGSTQSTKQPPTPVTSASTFKESALERFKAIACGPIIVRTKAEEEARRQSRPKANNEELQRRRNILSGAYEDFTLNIGSDPFEEDYVIIPAAVQEKPPDPPDTERTTYRGGKLVAISRGAVIQRLCTAEAVGDYDFYEVVLFSFRFWSNPKDFVTRLQKYFDKAPMEGANGKPAISMNLLPFLELWITKYWRSQQDEEAIQAVDELLFKLANPRSFAKLGRLTNQLREELAVKRDERTETTSTYTAPNYEFLDISPSGFLLQGQYGDVSLFDFNNNLAISELARQLTVLEMKILEGFDWLNFVDHCLVQKERSHGTDKSHETMKNRQYNLSLIIGRWPFWYLAKEKDEGKRKFIFMFFMKLAIACVAQRNLATAGAIFSGLHKGTFLTLADGKILSPDPKSMKGVEENWHKFLELFDTEDRSTYDALVQSWSSAFVPLLWIIDQRLQFIKEMHPNQVPSQVKVERKLINLIPYQKMLAIMKPIVNYGVHIPIKEHEAIQGYLEFELKRVPDNDDDVAAIANPVLVQGKPYVPKLPPPSPGPITRTRKLSNALQGVAETVTVIARASAASLTQQVNASVTNLRCT